MSLNRTRVEEAEINQRDRIDSLSRLPKATVIIVNTNELHHLKICLPSVFAQNYPDFEVLIVDNASSDGSVEYIEAHYPKASIIRNLENLGYTGANNVGFMNATGEFIAVLNPDTRVESDWLKELVLALLADPSAGLATPKILLMDRPMQINTCGNEITFTGLTFCRGLDEPAHNYQDTEIVPAVSGAAFVIRKSVLDRIGGFDDGLFIYYEDTDLSLRARLAGFHCLYVPTSVIYHRYRFRFSARKCFYQERNRYISMLKIFRWRTIVLLLPTLFVGEVVAWGYAFLMGWEHTLSKLRADLWLVANWRQIMESRRCTQRLRQAPDKDILSKFGYRLRFTQTTSPVLSSLMGFLFNPGLWLPGCIYKKVIIW